MRIVLTGSPGSGKTSIIEKLEKLGHIVVPEPARTLISSYQLNSPELLPHLSSDNRKLFQYRIEKLTIDNYSSFDNAYFDRSILDEIGYRNRYKIDISDYLHDFIIKNKYDKVFFFPFWKEIYKTDDVRKEDTTEAELIGKHLYDAYCNYGYSPIIVPKFGIEDRLKFILEN